MKHARFLALVLVFSAVHAAEPAYRYSAPITVERAGAFVQLPLPASAYARALQAGLSDLRVVDARGEPVPFALLPPRDDPTHSVETRRPVELYPLPRRAAASAALSSPLEVLVQGDRISVRPTGKALVGLVSADTPGWLVDLGKRSSDEAPAQILRLGWTGLAEFNASFHIDCSDTLREWHQAGSGHLLALASPTGALVQRDVPLPAECMRFVRLVWRDPATAPVLSSAEALSTVLSRAAQDAPTELQFAASPEPGALTKAASTGLHFDLGGPMPVLALDLKLPTGTHVLPARMQGRIREGDSWHDLGSTVYYQLERGAAPSRSPPMTLQATARYVRVLVDDRSPAPEPAQTTLVVQTRLATLVFAMQGQAPFSLEAGSNDMRPRALPINTLVPQLDDERARLGLARLGDWSEQPDAALAASTEERKAALRPWLLWSVLLFGVFGLGLMVWRLTKARPAELR